MSDMPAPGARPKRPSAFPYKAFVRRKSSEQLAAQFEGEALKRSLGPANLISLGVGCIIGTGIFVLTGQAAANFAGPAIILSFVVAGLACAFAGLCYAEMASTLPVSGSAYAYSYATLGEGMAWIMGLLLLLEYGLAASTVAVGWSGYVTSFLAEFGVIVPAALTGPPGSVVTAADGTSVATVFNLPAFLGVLMVTALLVIGVTESARVNNIIVAIKVTVILAFIAIGFFYVNPDNWTPFIPAPEPAPAGTPDQTSPMSLLAGLFGGGSEEATRYGLGGMFRAAAIIFFAYVGFEAVSAAAPEAKNPKRDLPVGILGSLFICTILYMLVSLVLIGVVSDFRVLNVPDPIALAVDQIGLGWFSFLIKLGAVAGLSSVMLVLVYGQTRIFYAMARDKLLPDVIAAVHPRFQTPWINTIIVGAAVALGASLLSLDRLADLVSLGTLAAFSIVCGAVMWLRSARPEMERPFRVPAYPLIPLAGIATCVFLMLSIPLHTYVIIGGYLVAGIVLYLLYGARRTHAHHGG